jgi:uncharacterized protein
MSYQPPRWLPGGHAQTIWPALMIRPERPPYRREIWDTPDGGRIALDFVDGATDAPLVVLFHGLEGSSDSHYARALMHRTAARGWSGVVPHFRGCGGMDNTQARAYHAGDAAEIRWILQRLATRYPRQYVAGVSLGGSMLLNYLGEDGERALPIAAAAISVPLDLTAASRRLDRGFGKLVYTRMFMNTLKVKALRQLEHHPELFDGRKLRQARTFSAFDHLVTAPLHGYPSGRAYWKLASSKQRLRAIARPTLVLNARNDPFLPDAALPGPAEVSPQVELEYPAHGGHAGFVTGRFPGSIDWLPDRLFEFFDRHTC